MKITIKIIKQLIIAMLCMTELLFFSYIYLCDKNGLLKTYQLRQENSLIMQDIQQCKEEIACLEEEIKKWQSHDFYKEKVAREYLQMARFNDEIFYIGKPK